MAQGLGEQGAAQAPGTAGLLMQVVSMFLASQRWALAQFVLQCSPPGSALAQTSKLQLLARTLPLTGLVCVPLSLAFEADAYTAEHVLQRELAFRVLAVAAALAAMLYAELKLVHLLSAVAFNVLATIHQIPIVLAGVVLQHNQVPRTSAAGFATCLLGALVYAAARH